MKNNIRTLALFASILATAALTSSVQASVSETDGLGTSWIGTPSIATATPPSADTTSEGNHGSGGTSNFGAQGQSFELSTGGTLNNIQLYLAGSAVTYNVYLYDLGTYPASGFPSTTATYTGSAGADLLAAGDTFTYNGGASGAQNVARLTFSGADANISLQAGELYAFELDPTTSASTFWVRGGVQTFNGQAYIAAGGTPPVMSALNGAIRDFDFSVTVTSAPEPASMTLIGLGALVGTFVVRRQKK